MPKRSTSFYVLSAILAYLPLRTLLYTYAGHLHLKGASVFQYLPEAILVIGLLMALPQALRQLPHLKAAPRLIQLSLGILILSLVSIFYARVHPVQGLTGVWFDFEGLLALLLIWLQPPSAEEAALLRRLALAGLLFIAVMGLVEAAIVPGFAEWLGRIGYVPDQHYVGKIKQIRSLVPGPNPLSTLMMIQAALLMILKPRYWRWLLLVTGLIIGLTFSRSSWLGVVVLGLASCWLFWRQQKRLEWGPILLGVGMVLAIFISTARYGETLKAVVTHNQSTDEHVQKSTEAAKESASGPLTFVFGTGIGSAGPASEHTKNPRIAESWYLQILQEIGLVGLALYLALMGQLILDLRAGAQQLLVWLTVGLMLNGLFLHIWADNHYLNLLFWILASLALFVPAVSKSDQATV